MPGNDSDYLREQLDWLSDERASEFLRFVDEVKTDPRTKAKFQFHESKSFDKEKRKQLHVAVKRWATLIDSITDNDGTVTAQSSKQPGGNRFQSRGWPSERPKYLKFVLHKENRETTDAINCLCKALGVKDKLFAWAGTKDKRGITTQAVTAHMITAEKMKTVNSNRVASNLKVGNFSYVSDSLGLGELFGNRFTITIRDVRGDDANIRAGVEFLQQNGFINYFGLQRFGTGSIATHTVGIQLIRSNWAEAVDLILKPRSHGKSMPFADFADSHENRKTASRRVPTLRRARICMRRCANSLVLCSSRRCSSTA